MGKLSKEILTAFIQSECERQLFLSIAEKDPLWIQDPDIKPPKRFIRQSDLVFQRGHQYEKEVYEFIQKALIYTGSADSTELTVSQFNFIYNQIIDGEKNSIILIEHEYPIPDSFIYGLCPSRSNPSSQLSNVPFDKAKLRPDLIVISHLPSNSTIDPPIFELLPSGGKRHVLETELSTRLAINIYDIKNTADEYIGKRQFIEILFYMHTLSHFLRESNLQTKFFVQTEKNGIFPYYEPLTVEKFTTLEEFQRNIVKMDWNDTNRLFRRIMLKITALWSRSPCSVQNTSVNIQPKCGFCKYLDDCTFRLGFESGLSASSWSVKLLPYISMSIADQLITSGYPTIGDVAQKIQNFSFTSYPHPLRPHIPLFQLKADALIQKNVLWPRLGDAYSYAIPRYSNCSISFAVEADPTNERVFVLAVHFDLSLSSHSPYFDLFLQWWTIWDRTLTLSLPLDEIKSQLDALFPRPIDIQEVKRFDDRLKTLQQLNQKSHPEPKYKLGTDKFMIDLEKKRIQCFFAMVNHDLTSQSEYSLLRDSIPLIYALIDIANMMELYIIAVDKVDENRFYRPDTALYYWSEEQMQNLRALVERHLPQLIQDSTIWPHTMELISWFSPADSEVIHPYSPKKIFDLRVFAESVMGIPLIINYTWHGILDKIANLKVNPQYWIPHYNYMDYHPWHEFLSSEDLEQKQSKLEEIARQARYKTVSIQRLHQYFQKFGKNLIPVKSRPKSNTELSAKMINPQYHTIAHAWYFFSKLTATLQDIEYEFYRTMFPEFSIGKLVAGHVSQLQQQRDAENHYIYTFQIHKQSINMKISEGDYVLLIPNEKRNDLETRWMMLWAITIEQMQWDAVHDCYNISSKPTTQDLIQSYEKQYTQSYQQTSWYLYLTTFDAWSEKCALLLANRNFGISSLGHLLASKWHIGVNPENISSVPHEVDAAEVYLYYPQLLINLSDQEALLKPVKQPLHLRTDPCPDPSQQLAISSVIQKIISAIQGPPGTGKSQTIAAIIDEYLLQFSQEKQHILITAFSYAAIRVLISKIRHQFGRNSPTSRPQLQLLFVRSGSQDPIESNTTDLVVDDLLIDRGAWRFNGQTRMITKTKPLDTQLADHSIIFANAHQLVHLIDRVSPDFSFNLIIVDEASQLPVDYFLASLHFVKWNMVPIVMDPQSGEIDSPWKNTLQTINLRQIFTKIVIVGDDNQLPPVQPIKPPKKLENVLTSVFSYFVHSHRIPFVQLEINYRSHEHIVEFTRHLRLYHNLTAFYGTNHVLRGEFANVSQQWVKTILDPSKVVSTIIQDRSYELTLSPLEAKLTCAIVLEYYSMINPVSVQEELRFWQESVGIVAPHNAHGRLIIQFLFKALTDGSRCHSLLESQELMQCLKNTIYSVEKFQGSDRDLIIATFAISDIDQLRAEEEFVYDLNRFNVLTSRAKRKVILICSNQLLEYIPDEKEVIYTAGRMFFYAKEFCNCTESLLIQNEENYCEQLEFRWYDPLQTIDHSFKFTITLVDVSLLEISCIPEKACEPLLEDLAKKYGGKKILNADQHVKWQFPLEHIDSLSKHLPIPNYLRNRQSSPTSPELEVSTMEPIKKEPPRKSKKTSNLSKQDTSDLW